MFAKFIKVITPSEFWTAFISCMTSWLPEGQFCCPSVIGSSCQVAKDGWNSVMMVMRFSLVFLLELHVKDLVRTMCDAWLICSEINL